MRRLLGPACFVGSVAIAGTANAQKQGHSQDRIRVQLERAEYAELVGDIVLAREHYGRVVELATPSGDERGNLARERFAALDARVPRLTVRLLAGASLAPVIKRDGVVLAAGMLGVPLPILPGRHEVVVEAVQRTPRTFVVVLAEGERRQLDVSPGAGAFRANGAGPLAAAHDEEDSEHTEDFSRRTVGASLGGAGLGGLGLGAVFGIVALSSSADDEAHNADRIATGFLIGGAVAAVAGAIVFFTAPSR